LRHIQILRFRTQRKQKRRIPGFLCVPRSIIMTGLRIAGVEWARRAESHRQKQTALGRIENKSIEKAEGCPIPFAGMNAAT
jgi:hypothetical protein